MKVQQYDILRYSRHNDIYGGFFLNNVIVVKVSQDSMLFHLIQMLQNIDTVLWNEMLRYFSYQCFL